MQHTQHGRTVRLPREYVQASTELGYACTVHTAQGVTADTMHGLATGTESRQQLYTMMTRGKSGNHVYLEVVGDGDPHSVIHPTLVRPLTPTDILDSILARDDAQRSATSLLRKQADPATRLGEAAQRYLDSLYVAAENLLRTSVGPDMVEALDSAVGQLLPGLSHEAAWPTLRAHLLLLGAAGGNPVEALRAAASDRELVSAEDRAAVLDWRLDASGLRNAGTGPLPWMPGVPQRLAEDQHWGSYLAQRSQLVTDLAVQVRERATAATSLPVWAQNGIRPDAATLADVEVWRAAMQVAGEDRRPTGAPQLQKASATYQRRLTRRVTGDHTPALKEWSHLLHGLAPQLRGDEFAPLLAERLAAMSRAGVAANELVAKAAEAGSLPDEHAAAALWWRMAKHLTPAVAAQIGEGSYGANVTTDWAHRLVDLVGAERAQRIQASNWWPALVSNIDHGLQRGWQLEALLSAGSAMPSDDVDECQALVWRTSIALEPIPDEYAYDYHFDAPPEDMWEGVEPPADAHFVDLGEDDLQWTSPAEPVDLLDVSVVDGVDEENDVERDLLFAELIRDVGTRLEPTEADIRRMYQRAEEWDYSPVTREQMLEINNLTQAYFEDQFTSSWGRGYLTDRFGIDLAGHEHFRPGQAPAGWNNLVRHLRRLGVSDEEMLAAGVASNASTGRLIDRFRDRVMFPVIHRGEVLGFVGRRHPDLTDADKGGPKYLNTADTPLFHKGAQLFGTVNELLAEGAVPVVVEGPMDAIAVTLASAGRYVGLAPLGTSLTDEQAAQFGAIGRDPVVATDADLAGQVAAERDFWMLTPHGLDPGYAQFPAGHDPADLLALRGPASLVAALDGHQPLGDELLAERLENLSPEKARMAAARVLAARPGTAWDRCADQVRARLQLSQLKARRDLRDAIKTWDADPRKAAQGELNKSGAVRARLQAAAARTPAERWASLATELDPRLVDQRDWPATAQILQEAHDQGHEVAIAARTLVCEAPLGEQPARDLRYRLVSRLDVSVDTGEARSAPTRPSTGADRDRQQGPDRPRRANPRR